MAEESGNDGRDPVGVDGVKTDISTPVEQAESDESPAANADASAFQADGEIPMAEIAEKDDGLLPAEVDEPDAGNDEPFNTPEDEFDDVFGAEADDDDEGDDSIPLAEIAGSSTSESATPVDDFLDDNSSESEEEIPLAEIDVSDASEFDVSESSEAASDNGVVGDDVEADLSGAFPEDVDLSDFLGGQKADEPGDSDPEDENVEDEPVFDMGDADAFGTADVDVDELDDFGNEVGLDDFDELGDLDDLDNIEIGEFAGEDESSVSADAVDLDDELLDMLGGFGEIGAAHDEVDDGALPFDLDLEEIGASEVDDDLDQTKAADRADDDFWGAELEQGWQPSKQIIVSSPLAVEPELKAGSQDAEVSSSNLVSEVTESDRHESVVEERPQNETAIPTDAEFAAASDLLGRLAQERGLDLAGMVAETSGSRSELQVESKRGRDVYITSYTEPDGVVVSEVLQSPDLGTFRQIEGDAVPVVGWQPSRSEPSLGVVFKAIGELGEQSVVLQEAEGEDALREMVPFSSAAPILFATTHLVPEPCNWSTVPSVFEGSGESIHVALKALPKGTVREIALSLLPALGQSDDADDFYKDTVALILAAWSEAPELALTFSELGAGEPSHFAEAVYRSVEHRNEFEDRPAGLSPTSSWSVGVKNGRYITQAFSQIAKYDWESALESLTVVLDGCESDDLRGILHWAKTRLLIELGRTDDAKLEVEYAAQHLTATRTGRLVIEVLSHELDDVAMRARLLESRLVDDELHESELFRLARSYEDLGQLTEAVHIYERIQSEFHSNYALNCSLARLYAELGDVDALRETLSAQSLQSDEPLEAAAYAFSRGSLAQRRLGDGRAAIEDYANALRILPYFTPAIRRLSRLWRAQGHEVYVRQHLADEIEALESELNEDVEQSALTKGLLQKYFRLARMAEGAGELEQCVALLKRTLFLDPDCEWAVTELERLFYREGHWVELSALLLGWSDQARHKDAVRSRLMERTAEVFLFHLKDRVNASRLVARSLALRGVSESLLPLALLSFSNKSQGEALSEVLEAAAEADLIPYASALLRAANLGARKDRARRLELALTSLDRGAMLGIVFGLYENGGVQAFTGAALDQVIETGDWVAFFFMVLALEAEDELQLAVDFFMQWNRQHAYRSFAKVEHALALILCQGRILTKAGLWRQAAEFWSEYTELVPRSDALWMLKQAAEIYEHRCADLDEARDCLQKYLDLAPDSVMIQKSLERVSRPGQFMLSDSGGHEETSSEAKVSVPVQDGVDWLERLRLIEEDGDMTAAIALLRNWILAEPQLSMAQWLLVDLMETSEQTLEPYLELLTDPLVRSHALLKVANGDVARLREAFSLNVENAAAFEALTHTLKSLGEWRELEALLDNMLEMDVEPEQEADFVARLVELHLGPLNQPQSALALMRDRLSGAVISDALLPIFIETALSLGDTAIVDSVLSQLDVVDAQETRPLRLKTHARLLMKEGRYEEAWSQLERLIRDESDDREVYEFGACVLGALGQWGYALNVLKAGLSQVNDGLELRRLCYLMGDIHQRVLEDDFSGAGWFLEAARHGGPDAELMRCFLDAVKERDQLKSDQLALIEGGFRFFSAGVDDLIQDGVGQDSTYLLAYDVFRNAGENARALCAADLLDWLGRSTGALDVYRRDAKATQQAVFKGELSENGRVRFLEGDTLRSPLFRAVDALGQVLGEVFSEMPSRTSNRLSKRSFREPQSIVSTFVEQLRLPDIQVWNGGRETQVYEGRLLPASALFLSRDVLEAEWDSEALFHIGRTLESFRFSRLVAMKQPAEVLLEVIELVCASTQGRSFDSVSHMPEMLAVKLHTRAGRLPLRITNVLGELDGAATTVMEMRQVQSDLESICDRAGLLLSGDIGVCLNAILFATQEEAESVRRRGGQSQLIEQNQRAARLVKFFMSGAYSHLRDELTGEAQR